MTQSERDNQYLHAMTILDQQLTVKIRENYTIRDEMTVLRLERNALLAYIAGEGKPEHREWIKAECLRRWKMKEYDAESKT